MQSTPISDYYNADLLALVPKNATRVVEVGCMSGALAREYLKSTPQCEYVGVEVDPQYADVARQWCKRVVVANIEQMSDVEFASLFPSSCWIFGDVLEHLYDPWSVLTRIRSRLPSQSSVVACIPNAQHWSVQARLNCGTFRYEERGLMDRTHIRWFTRTTILEMFKASGFDVVDGGGVIADEPLRADALVGVRAMATAIGADPDAAAQEATPLQWIVRAVPSPTL
jgi:Precorrin-6B methylase 2